MAPIISLLGEELLLKSDTLKTTLVTAGPGKVVGLYFSAHWCPPCRGFTPELVNWYNNFKETARADELSMIFVSSDRDEKSFDEYYAEMPWHALPYQARDIKAKLSKKFGVSGIPTLVFIDGESGKVITKNGRENISSDPTGEKFPYHPKPLAELLAGPLKGKKGETDFAKAVEGKYRALYFSAHWCGPCRGFSPKLIETYNRLQEDGMPFEVIFVSWDNDEAEFDEYFKTMPWLAIPHEDPRIQELGGHFEVDGIPCLLLLDQENKVISKNARSAVDADPEGKDFPWFPKPLDVLSPTTASAVNDTASLLYFTGGDETVVAEAESLLEDIAEAYLAEQKASVDTEKELDEMVFLYENNEESSKEVANSIKRFLNLNLETTPFVVLLNIPGQERYLGGTKPSKDDIQDVVNKFKSGELKTEPVKG